MAPTDRQNVKFDRPNYFASSQSFMRCLLQPGQAAVAELRKRARCCNMPQSRKFEWTSWSEEYVCRETQHSATWCDRWKNNWGSIVFPLLCYYMNQILSPKLIVSWVLYKIIFYQMWDLAPLLIINKNQMKYHIQSFDAWESADFYYALNPTWY